MVKRDLLEYAKEALSIQVVKFARTKGEAAIDIKDLAVDEIISFIYDEWVHDSSWGKMIMDEKAPDGKTDSEAESVAQKTIYMLAGKWLANSAGVAKAVNMNTLIDIGAALFLKDYMQGKTSVGN